MSFLRSVTTFPSLYSALAGNMTSDWEIPNSENSNLPTSSTVQAEKAHTVKRLAIIEYILFIFIILHI